MASCCPCEAKTSGRSVAGGGGAKSGLPLICLVPRDGAPPRPDKAKGGGGSSGGGGGGGSGGKPQPPTSTSTGGYKLLDNEYLKKHFKLPPRSLYLDPFRRPLISFPMTQESRIPHFNLARKTKINQQILDGFLHPDEAISAPTVFPFPQMNEEKQRTEAQQDEETIYILQLPDWEYECPIHHTTVKTPRFIWHSCKKEGKGTGTEMKKGAGPLNKPKPWLLCRHTDFDFLSQW